MRAMHFAYEMRQADYLEAARALGRRRRDAFRPIRWCELGTTAVGFALLARSVPHAAQCLTIEVDRWMPAAAVYHVLRRRWRHRYYDRRLRSGRSSPRRTTLPGANIPPGVPRGRHR